VSEKSLFGVLRKSSFTTFEQDDVAIRSFDSVLFFLLVRSIILSIVPRIPYYCCSSSCSRKHTVEICSILVVQTAGRRVLSCISKRLGFCSRST
jgi:hypothetical protein